MSAAVGVFVSHTDRQQGIPKAVPMLCHRGHHTAMIHSTGLDHTVHSRFEEDKIRFKENISALLQRARNSIWGGSINHATNNVKYLKKSA